MQSGNKACTRTETCVGGKEHVQHLEKGQERRNRGGVMIMKQNRKVTAVRHGNDSSEVMSIQALVNGGEKNAVITADFPPEI